MYAKANLSRSILNLSYFYGSTPRHILFQRKYLQKHFWNHARIFPLKIEFVDFIPWSLWGSSGEADMVWEYFEAKILKQKLLNLNFFFV